MGSPTIFLMDMASIMVGDGTPNDLNSLNIEDLKVPMIQEVTTEHKGGGAIMGVKLGMNMIETLDLTFKLKGFSPNVSNKLGMGQARRLNYTIRGNVRDVREDRQFSCKVVVNGRMCKVDGGSFARDSGTSEDFEVNEIMKYQCFFDDTEKFYFDYFAGPAGVRIDGNSIFATAASNLGLI
jgi:phage tail tube protein FII